MTHRREPMLRGTMNRVLQELARMAPGARTLRVWLHRARGVRIGDDVWIGYDAILETAQPELITIEDGASIGIRATLIAHFRETKGVTIERDAFVGPGAIILPSVVVGHGAVVTAGSVVTRSIAPLTVVQGNPAVPIAKVDAPFRSDMSLKQFSRSLKRIGRRGA